MCIFSFFTLTLTKAFLRRVLCILISLVNFTINILFGGFDFLGLSIGKIALITEIDKNTIIILSFVVIIMCIIPISILIVPKIFEIFYGRLLCLTLFVVIGILGMVKNSLCFLLLSFFFLFLGAYLEIRWFDKQPEHYKEEYRRRQRQREEEELNKKINSRYICPNCGMRTGYKINVITKAISIEMTGLASDKIGKTYQCENCKYM